MTQKPSHTPLPWFMRSRSDASGEMLDCFVAAKDVHGYPYDAEILGDDEYRDSILRKEADCKLIVKAVNENEELHDDRDALLSHLAWAVAKLRELGQTNDFTLGMVQSLTDCDKLITTISDKESA